MLLYVEQSACCVACFRIQPRACCVACYCSLVNLALCIDRTKGDKQLDLVATIYCWEYLRGRNQMQSHVSSCTLGMWLVLFIKWNMSKGKVGIDRLHPCYYHGRFSKYPNHKYIHTWHHPLAVHKRRTPK